MEYIIILIMLGLVILLIPVCFYVILCVIAIPFGFLERMDIYEKMLDKIDNKLHFTSAWEWWEEHIYEPFLNKSEKYGPILFIIIILLGIILRATK